MSLARTLFFLLSTSLAMAQPIGYAVGITAKHNDTLNNATTGYDSASETLLVNGTVSFPAGANTADFTLRIQNVATTFTPTPSPNVYSFIRALPMGPTAPPLGWAAYAYSEHYVNEDRISRPIVAELVKNGTNEVFARTRVVLLDNRRHPLMVTNSSAATVTNGLALEVTSRGLDNLQNHLRSASPQPSLTDFNGRLTEAFRNYENSAPPLDTALTSSNKACVKVSDLPPDFLLTPAFLAFSAETASAYAAYQVADSLLNNTAAPAGAASLLTPTAIATLALVGGALYIENSSCVREVPLPARMELCARSLNGTTRSMSITGLGPVDLQVGTTVDLSPPNLLALNTVNNPTGVIDGKAADFFFRYSHEPGRRCANDNKNFRPTQNLPANQIPATSTMDNFRSCNGITISTPNATQSVGSLFEFRAHTGNDTNPERHRVEHASSPNRIFTLNTTQNNDTSKGLCAFPQFQAPANALAAKFYNRLRNSLDTAWKRDDPNTQQAKALDLVFSKWETGIFGDLNLSGTTTGIDHVLTHSYNLLSSKNLTDRIFLFNDTSTLATSGGNAGGAGFVYSTPGTITCSSSGDPCPSSANRFGNRFDLGYTVTTASLNEMLRRLATTSLLSLNWQPTYDELGVVPPVGTPGTATAILNGPTLAQINPAFATLGPNVATLRFTPTINPYTYMNPEPPPSVPEGTENLTYNLIQYKMELVTSIPGPLGDNVWLEAFIDFFDPELDLRTAVLPFRDRLVPTLGGQRTTRTLAIRHAFSACPMGPVVAPIQPPPPNPQIPHPTCGDQLAGGLFNRFRPFLTDRLTYMLSRFPAPVIFNAAGQGNTLNFNPTDRFQWTNAITFYGNLQ